MLSRCVHCYLRLQGTDSPEGSTDLRRIYLQGASSRSSTERRTSNDQSIPSPVIIPACLPRVNCTVQFGHRSDEARTACKWDSGLDVKHPLNCCP